MRRYLIAVNKDHGRHGDAYIIEIPASGEPESKTDFAVGDKFQ